LGSTLAVYHPTTRTRHTSKRDGLLEALLGIEVFLLRCNIDHLPVTPPASMLNSTNSTNVRAGGAVRSHCRNNGLIRRAVGATAPAPVFLVV